MNSNVFNRINVLPYALDRFAESLNDRTIPNPPLARLGGPRSIFLGLRFGLDRDDFDSGVEDPLIFFAGYHAYGRIGCNLTSSDQNLADSDPWIRPLLGLKNRDSSIFWDRWTLGVFLSKQLRGKRADC
jgi:hypothetical protein